MISRRELLAGGVAWLASSSLVRAQQPTARPRVSVLWHAANIAEETPYYQSLLEGFQRLGYVDGRTITLEHRFPDEKPALFTRMADELVASAPDILVAVGSAAPYAKKATSTIPIVFMYVPDPIGAGLVETIRRPGGNATGLTNFSVDLSAKRLQYLKEAFPPVTRVALLINPGAPISRLYVHQSQEVAPQLGLDVSVFEVGTSAELEPAFDAMLKAGVQGVVVNAESLFYQLKTEVAGLAIKHRLPTCSWVREVAEAGTLISYGADQRAISRRVATYVDRILKGERPADMPVEQPSRFELIANLKTATALGYTIPQTFLSRVDDSIE